MGVEERHLECLFVEQLEESSVTLVTEVFAGCVQYSKLMQVTCPMIVSRDRTHDLCFFRW